MLKGQAVTRGRDSLHQMKAVFLTGIATGVILIAVPSYAAESVETVVVTGYREALTSALSTKRNANNMVDAINAEDIAKFPDANLAEALQRIPGIAVDRDNGEGRTITVRGLSGDFTRVRLNGLEALSTAAASDSGTSPNRTRQFDFNTFASELFSSLKVNKTASAEIDEGALGATVDLVTGKPFDYAGGRLALNMQDAWYENGGTHNPRIAGLATDTWFGGRLGALVSAAWNTRNQPTDMFVRQPGQSDYVYRGSLFAGSPAVTNNSTRTQRQGFAAPTGTACNNGVVPGQNVTNAGACAAMSGSDPAAYATVNTPIGAILSDIDPSAIVTSATTAPGSLVRIPALANLQEQALRQDRLGITGSVQWQVDDHTLVSLDVAYSHFYQDSQIQQLQTVGLNRNNTNSTYNTANGATTIANRRGTYATCTARAATATLDAIDCGGQLYGTTPAFATAFNTAGVLVPSVLGTNTFSVNSHNLEPYDYYNNPASVGYVADPLLLAARGSFIGRPGARILNAHVTNGAADYLVIDNVDERSAVDESYYTTEFQQGTIDVQHQFFEGLNVELLYGRSQSNNRNTGLLAEFNRMDAGTARGDQPLIYDNRGGGPMPVLNFGFDTADPSKWEIVKGFSALRHFERQTLNKYDGGRLDLNWKVDDEFTVKFGLSSRIYSFYTNQYQRLTTETLNPTLKELGITTADVSKTIDFGTGLQLPAGTTTRFIVPDIRKLQAATGFDCNCVNKYGDWTLSLLSNPGNTFSVSEYDRSVYAQVDYDLTLLGRPIRGNAGVRWAFTDLTSRGLSTSALPLTGTNAYNDILPSANVVYEVADDMLVRFGVAKVMARPLLGNLSPSVTAISVPSSVGATTGASLTLGNPKLSPFRATNFDMSYEWYFDEGAVFSVALFSKQIKSVPQTVLTSGPLSSILDPTSIAALRAGQTNAASQAYIDGDFPFDIRQFRDAPGGMLEGVEVNFQDNFTWLPDPWDGFGVQANFTLIKSKLHYILNVSPLALGDGPFQGASPEAANFTLYYENKTWSARVSTAYRSGYVLSGGYPIASGTCDPGFCDSPLVNDFLGNKATINVDMAASYNLTDWATLTLDALNLTNQTTNRWAYIATKDPTLYSSTGRQVFLGVSLKY